MSKSLRSTFVLLFAAAGVAAPALADTQPEILHYRFDGSGLTTPNAASNPPPNTTTAFIGGGHAQTGADLNLRNDGHSLVSSGAQTSVIDFVNTQWVPDLTNSSWTISFVTEGVPAGTSTQYVFGELNNTFRCFTGGVAQPGNWLLRGSFVTEVLLPGGASMERRRSTFVYDLAQNRIFGYIDGVQVADVAQVGSPGFFNASDVFKVGGYGGGNGSSAIGATLAAGALLDDFRFYSRALSAQEVAEIDRHSIVIVSGKAAFIEDGDTSPSAADGSDFGAAAVGVPIERTFTVINGGDLPMTLGAVAIEGPDAANFSVVAQTTSPVASGDGIDFTVRFVPVDLNPRTATVRFDTDDPEVASFDFAVQGNGAPEAVFADGFES
jgi:hypothetical protein